MQFPFEMTFSLNCILYAKHELNISEYLQNQCFPDSSPPLLSKCFTFHLFLFNSSNSTIINQCDLKWNKTKLDRKSYRKKLCNRVLINNQRLSNSFAQVWLHERDKKIKTVNSWGLSHWNCPENWLYIFQRQPWSVAEGEFHLHIWRKILYRDSLVFDFEEFICMPDVYPENAICCPMSAKQTADWQLG